MKSVLLPLSLINATIWTVIALLVFDALELPLVLCAPTFWIVAVILTFTILETWWRLNDDTPYLPKQ